MTPSVPGWLAQRQGQLRQMYNGRGIAVLLDGKPQYVVMPVPVQGRFGVRVVQSINGRPLSAGGTFATAEEAVGGGLEELRQALGW